MSTIEVPAARSALDTSLFYARMAKPAPVIDIQATQAEIDDPVSGWEKLITGVATTLSVIAVVSVSVWMTIS